MVTRGRSAARNGRKAAPAKKPAARQQAAPARKPTKPAAASKAVYDVTKAPTDYHKQFALWAVKECGLDLTELSGVKAAFLKGIQIATAARPVFMKSDFLEEWREREGIAKRGPKGNSRTKNRAVVSDDEFDDESDDFEDEEDSNADLDSDEFDDEERTERYDELSEMTAPELRKILKGAHEVPLADYRGKDEEALKEMILDIEFPDDESEEDDSDADESDDEFDDDESEEDDSDEFEDEEEEPAPPKRRGRPAAAKPAANRASSGRNTRGSAATKKPAARAKKPAQADDEYVF